MFDLDKAAQVPVALFGIGRRGHKAVVDGVHRAEAARAERRIEGGGNHLVGLYGTSYHRKDDSVHAHFQNVLQMR